MEFKVNLKDSYRSFVLRNKNIKGKEVVYKLSFSDGLYYIGCTSNLAGRIYNHLSLSDTNNCKRLSKKHIRMIEAKLNNEFVKFEILDYRMENERKYILKHLNNKKCLNMKH